MEEGLIYEDPNTIYVEEELIEEHTPFSIDLKPALQNNQIMINLIELVNLPYYMKNYAGIWDLRNKQLIHIIKKLNDAYTLDNLKDAKKNLCEIQRKQVNEFTYLGEEGGKRFSKANKKIETIKNLIDQEIKRMEIEKLGPPKELETAPGPPVLKK